ncbi:MAG: PIN domain-containing protein [Actinobacteria bacterium]|nr:PIN domain-containing protein [Actinomycetota bacterium]MCG2819495.1 PIN domain-containing protein [Actinomycetes bacterium]MBU4218398.1 PIN domain-containing protein [Actinomycetota bacterium]MBU4358758.1 PIN domain-containing protein [Actinomycetota bacterium]MBU4391020.1 PIN domain-containing protein [Actinomycetota bacterium]
MRTKQKVFLDACCWVAGTLSRIGGSRFILALAKEGHIEILATKRIVVQTVKALGKKYGDDELRDFLKLFSNVSPTIVEDATDEEGARWSDLTHEDDCHVLAGAMKGKADILVSLDRKHVVTEKVVARFPIPVMTTKEFLDWFMERTEG